MKSLRSPLLVLVLPLLGACGIHSEYVPTAQAPRPLRPRPAESVEVFVSKQPARPYAEVGLVEVQQERYNHASAAELMWAMRTRAGQSGCDGLVFMGDNDADFAQSSTTITKHSVQENSSERTLSGYRGVCVVYTDVAAPAGPPGAGAVSRGDRTYPTECRPMRAEMRAARGRDKYEIIRSMPKECL